MRLLLSRFSSAACLNLILTQEARIIDAAWYCHIALASGAFVHCIPAACWREGDHLFVHGSNGSRLLKALAQGAQASVCITHLDGLVSARSAFHHSMNFRSVVMYGHFDQGSSGKARHTCYSHLPAASRILHYNRYTHRSEVAVYYRRVS